MFAYEHLSTTHCCMLLPVSLHLLGKWERSCISNDLPIVPSAVLGLPGHLTLVKVWSKIAENRQIMASVSAFSCSACLPMAACQTSQKQLQSRKNAEKHLPICCTQEWREATELAMSARNNCPWMLTIPYIVQASSKLFQPSSIAVGDLGGESGLFLINL